MLALSTAVKARWKHGDLFKKPVPEWQQGLEECALAEYECLKHTPQAHVIILSVELLHLKKKKKIQSIYTEKLKLFAFNTSC